MKIFKRKISLIGNKEVQNQILSEIELGLNSITTQSASFIVNDSLWYWQNPAGKAKPSVVNSAKFITYNFQRNLKIQSDWTPEKKLLGQAVDAYKEFESVFELYRLPEPKFLAFLQEYERITGKSSGPVSTSLFRKYCQGGAPEIVDLPEELGTFFEKSRTQLSLRAAIEFETGNIASSFRAANKLEFLYNEKTIDLGIFITSNDKPTCAARIWPVSNRNGSFQELENRNFGSSLTVPLWQLGFAPDGFDRSASYLGDTGITYDLEFTGNTVVIDKIEYEIWKDNKGQDRLSPKD